MKEIQTASALREGGISSNALRRLVRDAEFHRIRRGYYSPVAALDEKQEHKRLIETRLKEIGDGAVLSHSSAAVLLGLPVSYRGLQHVYITRPGTTHGQHRGVIRLSRAQLPATEIVELDGVRVTSLARTVTDLARTGSFSWGVVAGDAALRAGMSREELIESSARGRKRRGNRKALLLSSFADERSESPLESLSRAQMLRYGLPMPSLQHEVFWRGRFIGRSDFAWLEYGVLGECDGQIKYSKLLRPGETSDDVLRRQKQREDSLRRAGFGVVRWGWAEALNGEAMVTLIQNELMRALRHPAG